MAFERTRKSWFCVLRPVVRNRNVALKAVGEWPPDLLEDEVTQALTECVDDPDDDVGARCGEVLEAAQR